MEKNTKLIIGGVLLVGGLIAFNKTDNKLNIKIKEDIGDKTLSVIAAVVGGYLIYKSIK
jgi:hypothetical protein